MVLEELDLYRLGVGNTLGAIHRLLLQDAETEEEKVEAVHIIMNSLERMMQSTQRLLEEYDVEGVEMMIGTLDEDGELQGDPPPPTKTPGMGTKKH